jgi:hypothetical protein
MPVQVDRRGRLKGHREPTDHRGGAARGVNHLDICHRLTGLRTGDGLATKHEYPPGLRSHGRVSDGHRERGHAPEGPSVGCGQDGAIRPGAVVTADHIGGGPDRCGRSVGARLGETS